MLGWREAIAIGASFVVVGCGGSAASESDTDGGGCETQACTTSGESTGAPSSSSSGSPDPETTDTGTGTGDSGSTGSSSEGSTESSTSDSPDATSSDSSSTGEPDSTSSTRHEPRPLGSTNAPNGYLEYLPPTYDEAGTAPMIVFWHGIGENGNGVADLPEVLREGPPRLIDRDQWPDERPFVVLSPQHVGDGCPTASEIQSFLAYAIDTYAIDPAAVYLTGLSCGAIGGWNYLAQFGASQVAAAVLIAGDGRAALASAGCALGEVPIWAFHGDADDVVSVQGTIAPVETLLQCEPPPDVRMTIYSGVGHNSWRRTYDLSAGYDVYAWLLDPSL